ncbi:MAG: TraB/GumN family protein, partial [Neisseria sp.]|nr:TraB/GumN family protein [Neisseria sp.]
YLGIPETYSADFGADKLLLAEAKQSGKPFYGLEKNEVMKMLAQMSDRTALAMIDVSLQHQDKVEKAAAAMVAAYERNDAPAMFRLVKEAENELMQLVGKEERDNVRHINEDLLLARRNRNWLPEINRHLNEGGRLIAVGALHLYGKNGLVSLLRGDGWTVEAVKQ